MSAEQELLSQIDLKSLPSHIAIIMDGNGRWARKRGMPRVAGHRAGIDSVRETVRASSDLGLQVLTVWAFSVDNWKRPAAEVALLMQLLKDFLRREVEELHRHNIRFRPIGRVDQFDQIVRDELDRAVERTAGNSGMQFNIALNYGGRAEIVDAVNRMIDSGHKGGRITEKDVEQNLYTAGLPDPDLVIRTSGELRLSNFMLWQVAYSEMWVTDTLWPDFGRKHLYEAIIAFQRRERRYGGLLPQFVPSR